MAEFNIECDMCGEHFIAKAKQAKYCPACKKNRKRDDNKRYKLSYRERIKAQTLAKKKPGFVPAKCPDDCLYLQMVETKRCMCGFFLNTGELRGCDPGPGCKRYVGLNADEKAARHRRVKWDVVKGYELYLKGHNDKEIAREVHTTIRAVKAYRLRVWRHKKEQSDDGI